MITIKIKKIIAISGLVLGALFVYVSDVKNAEAGCPKGKVCFSDSGCGNFNIGNKHYGGSEQCAVLGRNCPPPPPPPPVHGVCGSPSTPFNKQTGKFNPSGRCASGSVGSNSWNDAEGKLTWRCNGSNGGSSSSCRWNAPAMNGQCGGLDGTITSGSPSTWGQMCSSGPQSSLSTQENTYKWSCIGTYGGSDDLCQAEKLPQVGKCGDLFESGTDTVVSSLPDNSYLCKRGTAGSINSSDTQYSWVCEGSGGAASSGTCVAKRAQNGEALTNLGSSTLGNPVTQLKVTGRITPNIVNKGDFCSLSDLEYTTNTGADDSFIACNVYRGSQIYEDKDRSKTGYQVEPGSEYFFKCADITPGGLGLTGQSPSLKCLLNPSVLER